MGQKGLKNKGIEKAAALQQRGGSNIRVVMPKTIARAISGEIGGRPMPALRYDQEQETKNESMNWYSLEDFSNTVGAMIGETAQQFQDTIQLVKDIGFVSDMARFQANVKVAMEDLTRFTDEFVSIKERHDGKNGIITEAADRMAYLAIFEDYRALAAYFQGTMHHKLIEFTEYALDAKDKYAEAMAAQEAAQATSVETEASEVKNV